MRFFHLTQGVVLISCSFPRLFVYVFLAASATSTPAASAHPAAARTSTKTAAATAHAGTASGAVGPRGISSAPDASESASAVGARYLTVANTVSAAAEVRARKVAGGATRITLSLPANIRLPVRSSLCEVAIAATDVALSLPVC